MAKIPNKPMFIQKNTCRRKRNIKLKVTTGMACNRESVEMNKLQKNAKDGVTIKIVGTLADAVVVLQALWAVERKVHIISRPKTSWAGR